jgi:hypothetical protein
MKHNKKRNTAFLYEILVKEATEKLYVENDISSYGNIIKLIKEMTTGSQMTKELKLYLALRAQVKTKTVARSMLSDVLNERKKINNKELFNEQTKFISKINKVAGPEIFNKFVKDYRNIGNLYHLFNNYDSIDIKDRNVLKESIVSSMVESADEPKKLMQPIDTITYNILIKRFNEKYSNSLLESQKEMIIKYIMSCDDEVSFKVYLSEEIERLTGTLTEAVTSREEITKDPEMVKKGKEIIGMLEEFKTKPYNEQMIEGLMKIQKLVEEIEKEEGNIDDKD